MDYHPIRLAVDKQKEFFRRSLSCFDQDDADFTPRPDMLTVVGHVHHTTASIELMVSGILQEFPRFEGRQYATRRDVGSWMPWGMEWTTSSNREPLRSDASLAKALTAFDETMDIASEVFCELTPEELRQPIAANPMGFPHAFAVLYFGIFDHVAHHRGALAQYARLRGKQPKIPYFDMAEALHESSLRA